MTGVLAQVFLYLLAAVVAVPLAKRAGLGSVLGYLLAGVAIGPGLGLVGSETETLQHFAEFGVVMMLFLVGLELEPRMLWRLRARLLGLGGLQVLISTSLIAALAWATGLYWGTAWAVGMILALSSTAIVLQSLNEKGQMKTLAGESSFAVLLFQDIAVIPMLALIPLLAIPGLAGVDAGGHHGEAWIEHLSPALRAGVTMASIVVVIVGGRYLVNPLLHYIARSQLRELFTVTALFIVIGIALLMSLVGLSPALGTFLAGVVLANSEFRHELESAIEPFKGLLLGLFFITVGAGINFALLLSQPTTMLGLAIGLMALKIAVLLLLGALFRIHWRERWLFALALSQAGEFAFVLLSFGAQNAVIGTELREQLSLIVALSMMLTPLLFIAYDRVILPRFATSDTRDSDTVDETGPILIAGQGRFGQVVNRMLLSNGYKTVVLDHRAEQIETMLRFGFKAFYGDASRPSLLHAAGLDNAKVLVVAIDDMSRAITIVEHARREFPDLHIVARAADRHDVYRLYFAGANDIIRETFDSSVRAGRSALEALGMHPYRAQRISEAFTQHDRAALQRLATHWDSESVQQSAEYVAASRQEGAKLEAAMQGHDTSTQDQVERGWAPPPRR